MSKKFLEIKNVDFNIGGKSKVKNASFEIENEGETICILGPSGIGKTTILRTIAGLEKIDKGSIILNDKMSEDTVAKKVKAIIVEELRKRLDWHSKAGIHAVGTHAYSPRTRDALLKGSKSLKPITISKSIQKAWPKALPRALPKVLRIPLSKSIAPKKALPKGLLFDPPPPKLTTFCTYVLVSPLTLETHIAICK